MTACDDHSLTLSLNLVARNSRETLADFTKLYTVAWFWSLWSLELGRVLVTALHTVI